MIARPVLRQVRHRLQKLLRRRGQTPEDAEDVIQDAFVRLQMYYRRGGEVREPEAFLVRTALRLSINARRSAWRRAQVEDGNRIGPMIEAQPAPEDVLAAEESLHAIQDSIETMGSPTREIFLLNRVDGLTYAQIAKMFGLTEKAVERRIARAMLAVFQQAEEPTETEAKPR